MARVFRLPEEVSGGGGGGGLPTGGVEDQIIVKTTAVDQAADWAYDWMTLARGWDSVPTFLQTIADGDVYQYDYTGSRTFYRLVPSGSAVDAFYSGFSGGVLSGLIASKEI